MPQELTEEQECEQRQIDDQLNNEATARRDSVEGARNCFLRKEISGEELDAIVEENRG